MAFLCLRDRIWKQHIKFKNKWNKLVYQCGLQKAAECWMLRHQFEGQYHEIIVWERIKGQGTQSTAQRFESGETEQGA